MEKGMIDLGKKYDEKEATCCPEPSGKNDVIYPTVYISDISELGNLPDGEFTFMAKGEVVSKSESTRDGKEHHSCEIEIRGIKVDGMKSPKKKDSGDALAETMDKMESEKSKSKSEYVDNNEE